MTATQVIQVLDQTVDWYRTLGLQTQAANEPSDLLILYDNRQIANRVMTLAFDIARANADQLANEQAAPAPGGEAGLAPQALAALRSKLDAQSRDIVTELDAARHAAVAGARRSRDAAQAKVEELQAELDLVEAKKSVLASMNDFAGTEDTHKGSLKSQIDAMAVAIPAVDGAGRSAAAPAATPGAGSSASAQPANSLAAVITPLASSPHEASVGRFGLWEVAAEAIRLTEKSETVTTVDRRTTALEATLSKIRAPLALRMQTLSARGDTLAADADAADITKLRGLHAELDALAAEFKHTSAMLVPLSRETLLLGQYRRNLANWRAMIEAQYHDAMRTLAIRLGIVLLVLTAVFVAAALWRRTVLRYVQDARRRYQLLLLRRIAVSSTVVIVVGVSFASELGSIVTFAGLLTAGIAVAMQSVLVSIVGYFFLIGKYGIRVGDRVQIGEVAGEVIDLGLVRMYLMELGAKGSMGPTGRVVAFANSVVFQVAGGLFKQIPGVNFSWRELTLQLPPGIDHAAVKERLATALTDALRDYRGEIVRQAEEIERTTLSRSTADVQPQIRLQFSPTGVEAHVRYPVHLQHAAEIDERVTEALAAVIDQAVRGGGAAVTTRPA